VSSLPVLRPELDLVFPEVLRVPVPVHLDPRDAAAVSLRPADATGLEGPHPARHCQPRDHRHRPGADSVMGQAIAFYTLAALILGFAVLVVSAKNTVHSVLFLVLNFLFVAALYVLLGAQFLAVIQVLVYAGGIVVLYLFVVMLVNLKRPPEDHSAPQRRTWIGLGLSGLVLAQLLGIVAVSQLVPAGRSMEMSDLAVNNVERIGMLLYTDYLIPFEVASMLLLVAMVGAIILAKREL